MVRRDIEKVVSDRKSKPRTHKRKPHPSRLAAWEMRTESVMLFTLSIKITWTEI